MMEENLVAAMVWVPSWRLMVISYEETLFEEGEVQSCSSTHLWLEIYSLVGFGTVGVRPSLL